MVSLNFDLFNLQEARDGVEKNTGLKTRHYKDELDFSRHSAQ